MKVVVVGRFPPPYGGVSIFVKRKYESMRSAGAGYVDLMSLWWPAKLFWLVISSRCEFYVNTGNIHFLLACYLLGALRRSYVYDHNASRRNWGRGRLERLYIFLVKNALGIRVVHQHLKAGYESRGLGHKVEVESPFLPPVESEQAEILKSYPEEVVDFLESTHGLKLALSASVYVRDGAGRDVYGIDALIASLEYLQEEGCEPRCLLAIAEFDESLLPRDLAVRMDRLASAGVLVKMLGQYQFWPVYKRVHAFLRLTSTDGDSISIREAIHFGCPVLASDVVPRPDGVKLYGYGNQDELNALLRGLKNGSAQSELPIRILNQNT